MSDKHHRYLIALTPPESVDFYSRSKKVFCVTASGFSDATAPGLTATSALTT
ncbi:TPA: hypothetical protein ACQZKP_001047 [Klebsiella quasipneumoniae subsp. similipneumoniae]|nr:hypothetical protein [Klebsiella quasipneumoniae]